MADGADQRCRGAAAVLALLLGLVLAGCTPADRATQPAGSAPGSPTEQRTTRSPEPSVRPTETETVTTPAKSPGTLVVSPNNRHLVTGDGKPFFMVADTAWSLMTGLAVEDAKTYIDLRKAQGFNTILTNVVFPGRDTPGPRGSAFAGGDLRQPQERWFAGVDEILAHAASQDMLIGLGTLWIRDNGGQTRGVLPSDAELADYGRYLGKRYGDTSDLFYFVGGDDHPVTSLDPGALIASNIAATDPDALITFHSWGTTPQVARRPWLDFYAFQWNSNDPPFAYQLARDTRAYFPARPVLDMEPPYDPEACCGVDRYTSEQENRRSGWWAALSGTLGVVYGGPESTWNVGVATGGQLPLADIDRPGAHQTARIGRILARGPWWLLQPDWDATTVVGDRGTFGGPDYVAAARAADGSWVLAYTPTPRDLTVDLSRLSGPGVAQWLDPATGEPVGDPVPVPARGTRTFAAPLPEDALLVLSAE